MYLCVDKDGSFRVAESVPIRWHNFDKITEVHENYHGRFEFIPVEDMELCTKMLIEILKNA